MNEHPMPTDPNSLSDGSDHHGSNTDGHFADTAPVEEAHSGMMSASGSADDINVGLIDRLQFSRDCLIRAFDAIHPDLCMVPFASIGDCIRAAPADLDLILYYSHDDGPFELLALQQIKTLRQAFNDVPIIVLSDAKSAVEPRNIRNALNSGAQGFIPTRSTEVTAALAAIRFVRDGGTFAPLDLLFDGQSKQGAAPEEPEPNRLTPRQRTVLSHLSQGKANKTIAYELGMAESTVKIHIRNIMRKMGATNRTQAVYKSQQLSA